MSKASEQRRRHAQALEPIEKAAAKERMSEAGKGVESFHTLTDPPPTSRLLHQPCPALQQAPRLRRCRVATAQRALPLLFLQSKGYFGSGAGSASTTGRPQ